MHNVCSPGPVICIVLSVPFIESFKNFLKHPGRVLDEFNVITFMIIDNQLMTQQFQFSDPEDYHMLTGGAECTVTLLMHNPLH